MINIHPYFKKFLACFLILLIVFFQIDRTKKQADAFIFFAPALWSVASTLLLSAGLQVASNGAMMSAVETFMLKYGVAGAELIQLASTVGVGGVVAVTSTIADALNSFVDNDMPAEIASPTKSVDYVDNSSVTEDTPVITGVALPTDVVMGANQPVGTLPIEQLYTITVQRNSSFVVGQSFLTLKSHFWISRLNAFYGNALVKFSVDSSNQVVYQSNDETIWRVLPVSNYLLTSSDFKISLKYSYNNNINGYPFSDLVAGTTQLGIIAGSGYSVEGENQSVQVMPSTFPTMYSVGGSINKSSVLGQDTTINLDANSVAGTNVTIMKNTDTINKTVSDMNIAVDNVANNTGQMVDEQKKSNTWLGSILGAINTGYEQVGTIIDSIVSLPGTIATSIAGAFGIGVGAKVITTDIATTVPTDVLDFTKLKFAGTLFTDKFPFSLPWDLKDMLTSFGSGSVATPSFEMPLFYTRGGATNNIPVTVSLSRFDGIASACRVLELFAFNIGLLFGTRKLLGGAS